MSFVVVACGNGHRIKAAGKLVGQTHACPRCGLPVTVPAPASQYVQRQEPLTDTGVMRILGEQSPLPPAPSPSQRSPQPRHCPRCETVLRGDTTVCSKCQCYVGVVPDFLNRLQRGSDTPTSVR